MKLNSSIENKLPEFNLLLGFDTESAKNIISNVSVEKYKKFLKESKIDKRFEENIKLKRFSDTEKFMSLENKTDNYDPRITFDEVRRLISKEKSNLNWL